MPTPVENLDQFIDNWDLWWKALRPRNTLTTDGSLDPSADDHDLSRLRVPGKNGFLSIIVGLRGWGMTLGKQTRGKSKWLEAVEDATSVLRVMVSVGSPTPQPDPKGPVSQKR